MRKNLLWISLITLLIFSLLSLNMIGITVAQVDHDIAVVSVTPSQTSVKLGELVNITVIVKNNGTVAETFNVTVYYDTTIMETEIDITLEAGANTTLTFTWNTTSVREEVYAQTKKEKTYTIKATATTVPDETDTADNTLISPSNVKVIAHYIAVIPQSTVDPTLTPGQNYTVSIYTDYNGSDIWAWQFSLTYNPVVLEGIEVVNGDLITKAKHPDADFTEGTFNNTLGKLDLTTAYIYYETLPAPTLSGPGTLANVTFRVKGTGDSYITLVKEKTKLIGPAAEYDIINNYLPYFYHILYGYFCNTAEPITHDIAVTSVTPSTTLVVAGELVNITVVVENKGTVAETFDVEVWYDYKPLAPSYQRIGKVTENLEANASKPLTFTWNTTGVKAGNHTITAIAIPVADETDTGNNTRESNEIVTVTVREAQPIPTHLIVGIVVVVVAIAIVVYAVGRRKKPIPE